MRTGLLRACRTWTALLGISIVTSMVFGAASPKRIGPDASQRMPTAVKPDEAPRTVTLITGDLVVIGAPRGAVSIRPGKDRAHIRFSVERLRSRDGRTERIHVIPEDAVPLLAAGQVDPLLFDVTELVRSGYDDASRSDLPLIMTYPQRPDGRLALSTLSSLGANAGAQLSSVNGTAVRVPKEATSQLWSSLAADSGAAAASRGAAMPALSDAKIWLDRMFELALDRSVPQIGAPSAWSLGYTGRGVTVAVIDSGADTTHPDLADRIIDYRNFTDEADEDIDGHGTHVASIIAGSGAASNGQYRGVAPDARLVVGKACTVVGCPASAVIEALQWAVIEKQAKVVNLSLGTLDSPGVDPTEMAIDRLSASHGALVVAAAGNFGLPGTIESPGTADAALSVGAVERDERIAFFSSMGPRPGDKAIKPDITAPGVLIVAARAAGAFIGEPVNDFYTALDGTSMATPHVAGAAAILAQRHPSWTPAQLKAALMGAAKPLPTASVFEQGAGRLDVAAAIHSPVVTDPAALSLGIATWPHDDGEVITRTVTYRSLASESLTLDLRLEATGPDGAAAPAGMFRISPAALTLPAGGAATVTLTVDTAPGLLGFYTGRIAAADRADAGRIVHSLPLAMEREEESHPVVLNHFDRDGQAASQYTTFFTPLDRNPDLIPIVARLVVGEVAMRLPRGRYAVESWITTPGDGSLSVLVQPVLDVSAPRTLTIDARTAKPVVLHGPAPAARQIHEQIGWLMPSAWGTVDRWISFEEPTVVYASPLGPPVKRFTAYASAQWQADRARPNGATEQELYASAWTRQGTYFPGLTGTVRPENMAAVHAAYASVRPNVTRSLVVAAPALEDGFVIGGPARPVELPLRRTEYYSLEQGIGWARSLTLTVPDTDFFPLASLESGVTRYRAPGHYSARWAEAPFAPSHDSRSRTAERSGDTVRLAIRLLGDRAGHFGSFVFEGVFDNPRLALYRNGTQIGEHRSLSGTFELPPEAGIYRLEASTTQELLELSRHIGAVWTFRSSHVGGDLPAALPLLIAQLKPPLNARAEALAGSTVRIPISVTQHGRFGPPRIKSVSLDVSFDEGLSWRRVPVRLEGGRWAAYVTHPVQGKYVSLRVAISDFEGNKVEQTLIRAYVLAAAP